MPNKVKPGNIPNCALDCWLHGFSSCDGDMKLCTVHLSSAQWARIARGSGIAYLLAEDCAEQGVAYIQIFQGEHWEQDESHILPILIHHDWPADRIIIIARE